MRPRFLNQAPSGRTGGRSGLRIVLAAGALLCWALWPSNASAGPSTLRFPAATAYIGERSSIDLESITDFPYQGFSASVAYNPAVISLVQVTSAGTIVEALPADFYEANLFPAKGGFVIGCLVDTIPPFDGRTIPGPGVPLAISRVIFDVAAGTPPQTTQIRFVDGFGSPPIFTTLSVSDESVRPDQLLDGPIQIAHRPVFVRGDANQDTSVDVADPVYLINYLFQDRSPPSCMDAADGNDDETVDLADAIFILQYYFQKGRRPPPPFPNPGTDPSPGRRELGCLETAF